eukprot:scaffold926_cov248-Pinguiococcus_pyrenoidosus.AAC.28
MRWWESGLASVRFSARRAKSFSKRAHLIASLRKVAASMPCTNGCTCATTVSASTGRLFLKRFCGRPGSSDTNGSTTSTSSAPPPRSLCKNSSTSIPRFSSRKTPKVERFAPTRAVSGVSCFGSEAPSAPAEPEGLVRALCRDATSLRSGRCGVHCISAEAPGKIDCVRPEEPEKIRSAPEDRPSTSPSSDSPRVRRGMS